MSRKRLGDILVESGIVTADQLQEALVEQKKSKLKLGDHLLQSGYITEQQLIEILEYQLGIPHVSLFRMRLDPSLSAIVPEELARRHSLVPLKKEENKLTVAMVDPLDYYAIDELRMSTGFVINVVIATRDEIQRAISRMYSMQGSVQELMEGIEVPEDLEEARIFDDNSPIVRLVNQMFEQAVQLRASDIHIEPMEDGIRVRFRIDGLMRTERVLPRHMQGMLTARLKIMANLNIAERRMPQDGRVQMNVDFKEIDIRMSTLPTIYGEKIVMRLLDLTNALVEMSQLGLSKRNLAMFQELVTMSNGIVLVTGPTGSGKSTTLYSALNHLNSEHVNIITVEDPVEYQLDGINQVQVNENIGMSFASALRSILRQDPDIIMVGEIRDRETAEIAIRAALTGHSVFSTLHTNDAVSSITRLVDMGIPSFLIASSVHGVLAQRLVRRICKDCKQEYQASEQEKKLFAQKGLNVETLWRGKGCASCQMTGYRGRIAVHEVFKIDDTIRSMLIQNLPSHEYKKYAMKNGMVLLFDDGLLKVKQGITTMEEIYRISVSQ
ncbi:type II secretion system protein E [Brevibacillus agri]|uniref:Type II secretion system protein E n=1 Tax=Brevibacillus agri TaxID=51101 RepID=A0A3M8AWB5_9BACL|nr:ATPase, T2SS/T4P/T4SS family [Brevibacillus agri]MCG5254033.1 Flp pilus assembly complex ATPase component TadA [Brevibacillus agri]MDR9505969.1 ATPase, T2SS/T4P/T4SS family [Brevibacillus agri]MED3500854.1 ATPase, T2SS/T4P/T4SS family [Brevibacillus agri]MED4570674.1 ATPase, T2SS/T4P/T4SS family [Brevibacillus agri]QAV15709.1 type II secretion system protein GspE [Brevibacillus agri]